MASLPNKLITQTAFKAGGDIFHELLANRPQHLTKATPGTIQACELHQGIFGTNGSVIQWNYSVDGKPQTAKQVLQDIDLEKKQIAFKMLEGDLCELYKNMIITCHVETKDGIDFVTWTIDYELISPANPPLPLSFLLSLISTKIFTNSSKRGNHSRVQMENLSTDQILCSETEIIKDDYLEYEVNEDVDNHGDEEEEEEDEDEEEEEEEFSFMCGANSSPIAAEDAFINGQLRSIFPLFNRDLLFSGEDSDGLLENLPMRPPVKKIFVETGEGYGQMTSSTPESEQVEWSDCEWSNGKAVEASPETCKKSNSTGFSKIWRFKELLGRSNSDGRDTFVFLNNSHAAAEQPATVKKESTAKVKKSSKGKTATLSAHEVYLKSKAKAEGRRRTYLPYRPELMGFFTNANGGLSKNVHPY